MTTHFTFFESYYDAVEALDNDTKAEFFDAICKYVLRDEMPSSMTPVVHALFTMAKPNLDTSKARREAGKKGGSKAKQTESKTEAKPSKPKAKAKQTASDKEKEKEKEKDKEEDKEYIRRVSSFEVFWSHYPKKTGKAAAEKVFNAAIKTTSLDAMVSAINTQRRSKQWQKDGGQYIPNPATWLNQGRWDDAPVEVAPQMFSDKVNAGMDAALRFMQKGDEVIDVDPA